jgi:NCAIR mutase (PurE)-related protein
MDAFTTSVAVAVLALAGGMAGLHLHRILPEQHLSKETQDVIRLAAGMLSVLASLVLGLMIATVKTSFNATGTAVRAYATDLTVLDETLRDYGNDRYNPHPFPPREPRSR